MDHAQVGKGELGAVRDQKNQGMRVWDACVQVQRKRVQGMCVYECRACMYTSAGKLKKEEMWCM